MKWRISRNAVSTVNRIAALSTMRDGLSSARWRSRCPATQNEIAGTP